MVSEPITLEQVVELARQLTPHEKAQRIAQGLPDLEAMLVEIAPGRPLQSAYGICRDLGPAPSAEDIAEVRRELFATFPRRC